MAKFHGRIGFGVPEETSPGVWVDTIVEHSYYGDVLRNTKKLTDGENLNKDLTVGNSISIVGDAFSSSHFFAMRYVEWMGSLWTVSDVEVQAPRLILQLGEVYNGPQTGAPVSP